MTPLEAFWFLRSHVIDDSSPEYNEVDRELTGSVAMDLDAKTAFKSLHEAGLLPEVRCFQKIVAHDLLPNTGVASFVARAPREYFETIQELIKREPTSAPAHIRVFNIEEEDKILPLYRQAAQLCDLLIEISVSSDRKRIFLYSKERLEIPIRYDAADLRQIPELGEMADKLSKDDTLKSAEKRLRDMYVSLFTQAVYDVVSSVPREKRLAHLIEHFDECLFKFKLSFRVYSDEANKALERYEDKRAGMIAGLNGILGNIQTSLVGVPLAGILALKEMKRSPDISYENIVIVIAVVIIGLLLLGLSWSQGRALEAIKLQHSQLKSEIGECGGGNTKAGAMLASMDSHQQLVRGLLIAVRIVVAAFMIIAVVALFCRVGPTESLPAASEKTK